MTHKIYLSWIIFIAPFVTILIARLVEYLYSWFETYLKGKQK